MESNYIEMNNSQMSGFAGIMPGSRTLFNTNPMMRGDDVQHVQLRVGASPDGIFGPKTEAAVKRFQQSKGLTPTGRVEEATWKALKQVSAPKTTTPMVPETDPGNNLLWWGTGLAALALVGVGYKILK